MRTGNLQYGAVISGKLTLKQALIDAVSAGGVPVRHPSVSLNTAWSNQSYLQQLFWSLGALFFGRSLFQNQKLANFSSF